MEREKDGIKAEETEDLTQVLEVINAKGDTGEMAEIIKSGKENAESEGNDGVVLL